MPKTTLSLSLCHFVLLPLLAKNFMNCYRSLVVVVLSQTPPFPSSSKAGNYLNGIICHDLGQSWSVRIGGCHWRSYVACPGSKGSRTKLSRDCCCVVVCAVVHRQWSGLLAGCIPYYELTWLHFEIGAGRNSSDLCLRGLFKNVEYF